MFDESRKQKNLEFLKSLSNKKLQSDPSLEESLSENTNNIDSMLRRTIYTEDILLYAKAIIKKRK